ncbi:MAG: glycoside hydrolase family 2 TIM barrel-domain containing protein [Spirosomataceae bacterium]
MNRFSRFAWAVGVALLMIAQLRAQTPIPLPEHPRPDFERREWLNLNGDWAFEFDKNDIGEKEGWSQGKKAFTKTIHVPFPWGSALSGVGDEADIAWYQKTINVSPTWKGKRVFVTIGASDWKTTLWLDGKQLGSHEGGYTPFSVELTAHLKAGTNQQLVIRADDKRRNFTLYGKQGYGNARGIWQTIYLEARGQHYLEALHFSPDIDANKLKVTAYLPENAKQDLSLKLRIKGNGQSFESVQAVPKGQSTASFEVAMPKARLWSLEDPFLYDVEAQLGDDVVKSYVGMRKISVVNLPGTNYPYVALNNKPIYLQLTLDQSYHPDGYYTFPSDAFMRNEVLMARQIGLNGIRTHIKADIPRKLYWADKLGVLVMSDLPNSWGEPDAPMQKEAEFTLREMIKRDFNHPAIFSWIVFNETWGLITHKEVNGKKENLYLPETQKWVVSMYRLAKSLDPTRIVEDNSVCCGRGHTETDLYSWHEYLPGWAWEEHMVNLVKNNYPGSQDHFEKGYVQGNQPQINSECGNVWGYDGSTGDVDWTWDYHRMMNTFRKYPKMAGWLYTEHHDVINEWNGYWRFDRTEKIDGLNDLAEGMSIKDFHSPIYLSTGNDISKSVKPNEEVSVPLTLSSMTEGAGLGNSLTLKAQLYGYDAIGQKKVYWSGERAVPYKAYIQQSLEPLVVKMPNEKSVAILTLTLQDAVGNPLHHNFMVFSIEAPTPTNITLLSGKKAQLLSVEAKQFSAAQWTQKQWNVLDGLKVNGAGTGYFEYRFKLPNGLAINNLEGALFVVEASAKELFAKDRDKKIDANVEYMLGSKVEPSQNPNSYPMTDQTKSPSAVIVKVNGSYAGHYELPDDPADHRGVLSWHYQLKDRKLREAGSYGYRVSVPISMAALEQAQQTGELVIRLEAEPGLNGGIAIYGDKFGRYPINPTVVLVEK